MYVDVVAITRIFPVIAVIVAILAIGGCASSPVANVKRNPELPLASLETFGWFEPLGTDRAEYESFVTKRLKRAVSGALERRGLRYQADDPDLLVNFYVNLEDRQEVRTVPAASASLGVARWNSYYFGYRVGYYDPWPAYELSVSEFQQGTLTVDFVDTASGELAWVGVLEGRVRRRTLEEEEEALREALDELFLRFP